MRQIKLLEKHSNNYYFVWRIVHEDSLVPRPWLLALCKTGQWEGLGTKLMIGHMAAGCDYYCIPIQSPYYINRLNPHHSINYQIVIFLLWKSLPLSFVSVCRKEEKDGEECWVFMGNYWTYRDNGFTDLKLPKLWWFLVIIIIQCTCVINVMIFRR